MNTPKKLYDDFVIPRLVEWFQSGKRAALVTLIESIPSGPRQAGSQMAICEDGQSFGFISGGCVEAALIAEAERVFESGRGSIIRYGEGSPYFDIELPCGSAIDLFIDPLVSPEILSSLCQAHDERRAVRLVTRMASSESYLEPAPEVCGPQLTRNGQQFERLYLPAPRLVVCGKGPLVYLMAQIAALVGMDVISYSTRDDTEKLEGLGASKIHTITPDMKIDPGELDPWTAVAALFHEHELELSFLTSALTSSAFYIGAMGSRNTHAKRLRRLEERGFGASELDRIHAPIGLPIGSKSPPEICISILAEVFESWRKTVQP